MISISLYSIRLRNCHLSQECRICLQKHQSFHVVSIKTTSRVTEGVTSRTKKTLTRYARRWRWKVALCSETQCRKSWHVHFPPTNWVNVSWNTRLCQKDAELHWLFYATPVHSITLEIIERTCSYSYSVGEALFGRIRIDYSAHYSAPKRIRSEYSVQP